MINFLLCFLLVLLCSNTISADDSEQRKYNWHFAGWYGGGCYPAVVPDPNIKNRLYLLSDVAGIWRSDTRGDRWYFINRGLINLRVPVLAIAPSDSNIIYAGTRAGVARSDNAGKSWRYLKSTEDKVVFKRPDNHRSIAIDRQNYNKLYAGTKYGAVLFSNNGGKTWKYLKKTRTRRAGLWKSFLGIWRYFKWNKYPFGEKTPITALYLTRDGKKLFASSEMGLMQYDLQEKQWTKIDVGYEEVWDIVALEGRETIYVTAGKRVAYSSDYGKAWRFTKPIPKGNVLRLAVQSGVSGEVKLAVGWEKGWGGGVFLSLDNGEAWNNVEKNLEYADSHNPTRAWTGGLGSATSVAFDKFNPETIYFSDWWAVWRSDNNGESWSEKIYGAPNTIGSDIHITPNGEIYIATMDDGLLKSTDGGKNYEAIFPSGEAYGNDINGHVWRVTTSPKNPEKVIATSSPWNVDINQVIISRDGGESFIKVRSGLPDGRPGINTMWEEGRPRALAIDPKNPSIVYLGIDGDDGGGLFISHNGGRSWKRSRAQPASKRIYNALAVDPTNTGNLFWGSCGKRGGVYKSTNSGKSWRRVFRRLNWIFDIAISRTGIIYAGGTTRRNKPALYASYDGGKSWKLLFSSGDFATCEAILIDPRDEKRLFIGTVIWDEYSGGKIFYSENGGKNWKDITGGLPVSSGPSAMAVDPKENMLYVLLFSGSAYKIDIDSL